MSWLSDAEPVTSRDCPKGVELAIVPRAVDIGNFTVHRALPLENRRCMVGPFIFWDQMGPGAFAAGQGVDVRPHPHIGLATVTYLFAGSLDHRDSLGNSMRILPGDINLMTAGSGIVHSERTGSEVRRAASRLFGIQSWLALPKSHEHGPSSFVHTPKEALPPFADGRVRGRVLLGDYCGLRSPIPTPWQTLYVDVDLEAEAVCHFDESCEERAVAVVSGKIELGGTTFGAPQLLVLRRKGVAALRAVEDTSLMLIGGAAMDGPRYLWWNLVSSSLRRLKEAAARWRDGGFASIPDDAEEFIPLPDRPFPGEE